jgi:phenylpropionate dioxygenase-like ring-hydroxylating dioxygenase large terminal subunit
MPVETSAPPRHCTFNPDAWSKLAEHWYPVALSRDVSHSPVAAKLLDIPLVLYRIGGEVVVAYDQCPHRGVPLTRGSGDAEGIVCAYHGLRYGKDGRCTHVPAQPGASIPSKLRLRTYPALEHYGLVWTCLQPGTLADIPSMPHWDEPDFQQITCPSIDIFGFAGRQIEGFLDVAHFGFVHTRSFGDPHNTVVEPYMPAETPKGFEVEYRSSVGNYPIGAHERGREGFVWLRHFRVHMPFTATLTVHFPDDGRLVIMNAASPLSARVTRLFVPIGRNFDKDLPVQQVYDFNRMIFEEDKAIVESQQPAWLPLDPLAEVHIMADRSSIAYRRALKKMGFDQFFSG